MSNSTLFGYPIPTARKVSPLRQRMIDDMTVRNFAPNTHLCYLQQVNLFARHFGRSPELLGPEEIRAYQLRNHAGIIEIAFNNSAALTPYFAHNARAAKC